MPKLTPAARAARRVAQQPATTPTTTINGAPYAGAVVPLVGPTVQLQPLPTVPTAAPAVAPANVNAAVAAALQAVATGTAPLPNAAQGGTKAQRWAALVAANAALTLLPNKRALTGQAFGGTAQCYAAASALAQAGQLTAANIQAACANLKVPNPKWPAYALGTWLVPANQ